MLGVTNWEQHNSTREDLEAADKTWGTTPCSYKVILFSLSSKRRSKRRLMELKLGVSSFDGIN